MIGAIEKVKNSLVATWDFLKSNYPFLLFYFFKIYVLFYGLVILFILVMLISLGSLNSIYNFDQNPFMQLLIIVSIVILSFIIYAMSCTAYLAVHEKTKGKNVPIINQTKDFFIPATKFLLLCFLILIIPFILLNYASSINNDLLELIVIIIIISIIFVLQFSQLVLSLQKQKGVVYSMGESYSLIKQNFVSTILFDIILIGVILLLMFVFDQIQTASTRVLISFFIPSIYSMFSLNYIISLFVIILIWVLIQSTVLAMMMTVIQYFFWNAIQIRRKSTKQIKRKK